MKRLKVESSNERAILTAMIVHDGVLARISRSLGNETSPFRSKWSNTVASWCLSHFKKFNEAPRSRIEIKLHHYIERSQNDKASELMESFLVGLSDQHEALGKDINENFYVDLAAKHFTHVRIERIAKEVNDFLEVGEVESAEQALGKFGTVRFAQRASRKFGSDRIKKALKGRVDKSIVSWPGDLDKFLSPFFERDGFIAFSGPEKRGKSFWLLETVYRALLDRRRVLYYVVGDMSEEQVDRRLTSRICRAPLYETEQGVEIPKAIRLVTQKGKLQSVVDSEFQQRPKITHRSAMKALDEFNAKLAVKEMRLETYTLPAETVSASDISQDIAEFCHQQWIPDVVVIDYADLLAPEPLTIKMDFRHQVNQTWKILRKISQTYHLLVVTATQTGAKSYDAPTIQKKHFSEDKRKASHVTGMLGVNQTEEEKQHGIYRLNWSFLRDGTWTVSQVIYTAGNLAIASPCIICTQGTVGHPRENEPARIRTIGEIPIAAIAHHNPTYWNHLARICTRLIPFLFQIFVHCFIINRPQRYRGVKVFVVSGRYVPNSYKPVSSRSVSARSR